MNQFTAERAAQHRTELMTAARRAHEARLATPDRARFRLRLRRNPLRASLPRPRLARVAAAR